jgi:hypothetical protein
MVTAYFDALASLSPIAAKPTAGGFLRKKAFLLYAGKHKSNDGRVHNIPDHEVEEYARNTNLAMDRGVEFPLVLDHAKTIVHKDGKSAKFGEVISDVTTRIITERDLPNPKMRHLLGKLGAFAEVEIRDRIEDVEKGLIKLLSPGLNLEEKRFVEASGVLFPAIHGPALFTAALDYNSQREQSQQFYETKKLLDPRYEDFCIALRNIEAADDEQTFGNDKNAMRSQTVDQFCEDLKKALGLDSFQVQPEAEQDAGYNPDPYSRNLLNPNSVAYSAEPESARSEFVLPMKRRRRTPANRL